MIRKIIHIDRDKCNGCGACAKACHEGAIDIVDGKAVLVREHFCDGLGDCLPACPMDAISGMRAKQMQHREPTPGAVCPSQLSQWPVQIKLAGVAAPYFEDADILIAADCTAYAYGNFHADFIRGRITLIGCPKLDAVDYTEKLTAIFASHNIRSVTVARMEVPCCGGIEYAVQNAIAASGKDISCRVAVIGIDGTILEERVS